MMKYQVSCFMIHVLFDVCRTRSRRQRVNVFSTSNQPSICSLVSPSSDLRFFYSIFSFLFYILYTRL